MDREQIMWAQKAKKDWDLKGDRNTKFFKQWSELDEDETKFPRSKFKTINGYQITKK